jgi:uncharacterized protein (DUF2141 family)
MTRVWRIAAVLVLATGATMPAAVKQARDTAPARSPGTASILGTVVTAGETPRGLRQAVVTVNHVDRTYGDTVITDDEGRYEFRDLPAGRYLISARKPGFLTTNRGAVRPGGAGVPVALADGARLTGISVPLTKGAVLSGTVRDESGEAVHDARIEVLRVDSRGGEQRVTPARPEGRSETDDRGAFRLFGLPPGEYLVRAIADPGTMMHGGGVHVTTPAEIDWARLQLESASPGGDPPRRRPRAWAPTYFPGVSGRASAVTIALGPGEERGGIDITTRVVATSRVSGTIAYDGPPVPDAPQIHLVDIDAADSFFGFLHGYGWTFSLEAVPPGRYALAAFLGESKYWTTTELVVSARDEHLSLRLQPPLVVRGRLAFGGSARAPATKGIRVDLRPLATRGTMMVAPEVATAGADGSFEVKGVMPGRYVFTATVPGGAWTVQGIVADATDVTTAPLAVAAGSAPAPLVVTLTDQPTELSGRFEDASGRPATDYFIIVFSSDQRAWHRHSRAIAQMRPATDGRFSVRALPPGEYLLAAVTDIERDQWFDPSFLRELVPSAVKVTLGAGEKKAQDLRIAR